MSAILRGAAAATAAVALLRAASAHADDGTIGEDYTIDPNTSYANLPATTAIGARPMNYFGNDPPYSDATITNGQLIMPTGGTNPGFYANIAMTAPITRMGVDFVFGTPGTTDGSGVCIAGTSAPFNAGWTSDPNYRLYPHVNIWPTGWKILGLWNTTGGIQGNTIASGTLNLPIDETVHRWEWFRTGNSIEVQLDGTTLFNGPDPTGQLGTFALESEDGYYHGFWELGRGASTDNTNTAILRVWVA